MRIGIFGGAFDPPHLGHRTALCAFLQEARLDLCYVIPSGIAPHKVISGGADSQGRLEMTRLAFEGISDKILISDDEVKREETSYSYLTVRRIREKHPEDEIFLFVGTDQFLVFETWKNVPFLLSQVTLCAMARYGREDGLEEKKAALEKEFNARILLLKKKAYIISSSRIREELQNDGFSLSLAPKVNDLITLFGYYGANFDPQRSRVLDLVKSELNAERLSHTLSVEREVSRLCRIFSHTEEKEMRLAALLHDLTKGKNNAEQVALLTSFEEKIDPEDLKSPAVLHGITASLLAEKTVLLSHGACLAIRYHTTGRKNMTLGEKILYFADYIESTRPHDACRRMREKFYAGLPRGTEERLAWLDACLIQVMEGTIGHLQEKNMPIHPMTLEAKEDLKQRKENQ